MMYLSRIRPRLEGLSDIKKCPFLTGDYSIHQMVWAFFSDSKTRQRDFLYRIQKQKGLPLLFAVSDRQPLDTSGLWKIEVRPYEPQLGTGQRLAFILRANPVVTKKDGEGKQHRHDVIMEAKTKLKINGVPKKDWPIISEIVQSIGYFWLAARAKKHGFSVREGDIRTDGYRQHRFSKPKTAHPVYISSLDFTGILTVTEPATFIKTLYHGIGAGKAFGFGMMMVKRIW